MLEIAGNDYLTFHECSYCKVPLAFRNGQLFCENCGRSYGTVKITDTPDGKFAATIYWHHPGAVDHTPQPIELVQK